MAGTTGVLIALHFYAIFTSFFSPIDADLLQNEALKAYKYADHIIIGHHRENSHTYRLEAIYKILPGDGGSRSSTR